MSTSQTSFLITCENTLDRTMLDVVAVEDGEFDGTTDTIISTKCCALRFHPLTIDIGLDGILVEIKLHIHEFVAYHIHVTLEDDGLSVLQASGGRLADDDVARLVNNSLQVVAFTKLLQVLNHLLLVLGRARNLVDFSKLLEHASRFQFDFLHLIMLFYYLLYTISNFLFGNIPEKCYLCNQKCY